MPIIPELKIPETIEQEKKKKDTKLRFVIHNGEIVYDKFYKYTFRERLRECEVIVLMKRINRRYNRWFVRYWKDKLK